MKIKSVEFMRLARDRISEETSDMTWEEEREYINERIDSFRDFLKGVPKKSFYLSTTQAILPEIVE